MACRSIAVAGKGGTGKTTIVALIISYLVDRRTGSVLAIDADPDANLGRLLGRPSATTVGDLREEVRREINNLPPGMTKASFVETGLHELIDEAEGFDLLTMGKGEGSGCYCYLNSLIRGFSDKLMPSYAWAVMDNEAGLEHLSRRTTTNVDDLLVVVNANPISFDTARKINEISRELKNGIRNRYVVTNMIPEEHRDRALDLVAGLGMEHIADIPRDPALEGALFDGTPLTSLENSTAKQSVYSFMNRIGGQHGTA